MYLWRKINQYVRKPDRLRRGTVSDHVVSISMLTIVYNIFYYKTH